MAAARAKLKILEKQKAQLQSQQAQLVSDNQKLLLRHALLTAWCEALKLLQEKQCHDPTDHAQEQEVQKLLNQEVQLLGELTFSQQLDCSSVGDGVMLPDPDALSPGDPMAYFKALLARAPMQEVETWTSLDAARMLRETVLQASLHRATQQAQAAPPAEQVARSPKDVWERYFVAMVSCVVLGRAHVNEGIALYNLETMQAAPEHAAAAGQRTATLPPLLGLTAQQMDIIAAGAEACDNLSALLHQQRQEVMAQMEAAAAAADLVPHTELSQGPSTSAAADRRGPLEALQPRQQHLATQQRLAARLEVLMSKQYMLLLTLSGLLLGCMSYEQLALSSIYSWPHPIRLRYLAQDICNLRKQQLAELQERGQQGVIYISQQGRHGGKPPPSAAVSAACSMQLSRLAVGSDR